MSGHETQEETTVKSNAAEETVEQPSTETTSVVTSGDLLPVTDDENASPALQCLSEEHPSETSPASQECSSILRDMLEAMKESVLAINSLQKSMEKEFQKLASTLVNKTEESNCHLQDLLQEMRRQNDVVSKRMSITETAVESVSQNHFSGQNSVQLNWVTCLDLESGLNKAGRESYFGGADHYDDKSRLGVYIGDPHNRPLPPSPSALRRNQQSLPDLRHSSPANSDLYSNDESGEDGQGPSHEERSRSDGEQRSEKVQDSHLPGHKQEHSRQKSDLPSRSHAAQGHVAMDRVTTQSHTKETPAIKRARNSPEKETVAQSESPKHPINKNQSVSSSRDVRPKEPLPSSTVESVTHSVSKAYSSSSRSSRHTLERNSSRISALGLNIYVSGDSESKRLQEALDRARIPDPDPPPKARSFDTVLCLDTSASMWEAGAFQQMIDIANQFINGVEDVVSDSGVEENIALVTFGGTSNIVQHLTNDFSRVRDAIERIEVDGKSPFFEAMVVCLVAFDGKGGTVSISGEYDVRPRIIFITDGHITESSDDPYGADKASDPTNTRACFSRLMMDLSPKSKPNMPHPIIFVPVGSRADRTFLQSMATLNDSQLVAPENIMSLCNYFKVQGTIGKVIVCLHSKEPASSSEDIEALVQALVGDMGKKEMTEVVRVVKEELQDPNRKKRYDIKPTDFDEVFEDKEGVMSSERLPLGSRVLRGPDWRWGDQDGGGAGTVVQHEDKTHPFTWVLWDAGGYNRYPYGSDMGYHVWPTEEHPQPRPQDGQLQIGMTVVKGRKWNLPGSTYDQASGVVIRKSRDGKKIKVRWENGEIQACPMDAVEFSGSEEEGRELTLGEEMFGHTLDQEMEEEEEDGERIRAWQWRDDWGYWHLYTEQQTENLERAYKRKKDGSCVIQRGNKNFRVMFRRMIEKDIDQSIEKDVQRVLIQWDEYQSLRVAEDLVSLG